MKAIKTLLAVSALATVGAAHAATVATFTYDDTFITYKQNISGQPTTATYGAGNFNGTGTLDDSGVLTINATSYFLPTGSSTHQYDATDTIVYTGTISGGTFNIASYVTTLNSCTNTTAGGCAAAAGSSGTFVHSVALSGLTTFSTPKTKVGANPAWNADTYTFNGTPVSSVPVPAAAWLFGSGLLGLAGTARRRRSV